MIALSLLLASQDLHPAFYLTPAIRGNQVAFSCEGDIWVGDLESRKAIRLTSDAGLEDSPSFSPDGKWIAFHGEYDGSRQAYIMPTGGGAPKRLTNVPNFRAVTGFTPDGKSVVFRARGVPTGYQYYTIPAVGGAAVRMPFEFVSHVAFGKSAEQMAFTRFARFYMAWFHYEGGMQNQIWVGAPGSSKQITNVDGTNEFPVWVGDSIAFVNENKAKFTLMSVPAAGGKTKALGTQSSFEIRELDSDGTRIIYEKGHKLEVFDPVANKATEIQFDLQSDMIHTRPYLVPAERHATQPSLSPNAKRVFAESRGQIISLPVGEGEARVWKSLAGVRLRNPVMSKDGKSVAYFSDQTGEMQLMIANADGTGERAITNGANRQLVALTWSPDGKWIALYDSTMTLSLVNTATGATRMVCKTSGSWGAAPHSFSPDSRYLAFCDIPDIRGYALIAIMDTASGKITRVSDGRSNDTAVAFSSDGRYLAFVTERNMALTSDPLQVQLNLNKTNNIAVLALSADYKDPFGAKDPDEVTPTPEPKADGTTKIDFDGLYDRRIELPIPPSGPAGVDMVGTKVFFAADGQIGSYDMASKALNTITTGTGFELSKDGSKMLVTPNPRVIDANGTSLPPTAGVVSHGGLRLKIEPVSEWKQIFNDSWRLLRDYFYVANMHGNDWSKIKAKYEALLPSVRSRNELDNLVRWMQSEIGSSHEYLTPGDSRDIKPRLAAAYLGIDVEPGDSGMYRITHIVRGDRYLNAERSPLARPDLKVKEGDYLIEIAGIPATVGNDIYQGLEGRAGQVVSVKINTIPTAVGARTIFVRPVADENRMRYLDWVEKNRQYVEKATNGKFGYLHIAAMSVSDMSDFIKQYFAIRDREAIIVDSRFNNGGFVQEMMNRTLFMSFGALFNMRESVMPWTRMGAAFNGPIAVVQNEFNISCGEEFPYRFRQLKRGPIIGRRTMGGEVGSSPGWPLIDGGVVSVPNYGMYDPLTGWEIEGRGVEPDIDVPSDPNAFVKGKDPQLDKAIEWLIAENKKNPPPSLMPPKDRVRVGGGG